MSQLLENSRRDGWTDGKKFGRTDGSMDGQTLFYSTLPAKAGVQKGISKVSLKFIEENNHVQ